jgi:hypothetical protein
MKGDKVAKLTIDRKLSIAGIAFGLIGIGLSLLTTVYSLTAPDSTLRTIVFWVMAIGGAVLLGLGFYLMWLIRKGA